ncbi:polysaccharide biosynthesis/export family protein [uncultured Algibacter sp.]|uniref:polysaccharide biosynthesis/export family protein n=1 Tax=uncultured Algibacter sp. TaxID=298659 RepID=UPI00262D9050|nr:polysaccharide biosynthesis/export family protein [uncultured Algibacter sp.]
MKRFFFTVILIVNTVLISCIPHKDTVYFQNKSKALDSINQIVETQKPYRVLINDILNINIKVLDQENVEIFNPLSSGGGGSNNSTSAERAYYDGFSVDMHGEIRVPTLGKINVLGYTTEEIEEIIKEKLLTDQFKETANVFVTVRLAGMRFTASGEIGSPGTKTLFQERVNIYEAIANSGEIPVTGNLKDVLIIRQYPQGQKIHHLDLTDIAIMNSPFYYIQPNDIIYVKPLKQKAWGTGTSGLQTLTTVLGTFSILVSTYLIIDRL